MRHLAALFALIAAASAAQPSVLFIAVDDLRPELNCYGATHVHSPNIDRLAARGTLFERAYCQVAVCGASRGSLLSGCRPETTNCWNYKTLLRSQLPDVLTLPQHFKQSGYRTAFLGKVYHSSSDDASSWTVDAEKLAPSLPGNGQSYVTTPASKFAPHPSQKGRRMGPATENGGDVPDEAYGDGENARRAVSLIEHFSRSPGEPFFLAVGFTKPHLPFNAPGKYWDLYDPSTIKIPSRADVTDGVSYAASTWGELKAYSGIPAQTDSLDDETTRRLIHGYYAATSFTDANVGKLLDALDKYDLTENTIIVFWGDHGWYLGEFGDWCKHTNDEVATRVPLIIAAPGLPAGQRTRGLTEFVDIYPSLCELTGLALPEHLEGHSFSPLLKDPSIPWKRAAFSQYYKTKPRVGPMLGTSVRTRDFRYTEWRSRESGAVDATELFDLVKDPAATRNVANDPVYAETIKSLSTLARRSATGTAPPSPLAP